MHYFDPFSRLEFRALVIPDADDSPFTTLHVIDAARHDEVSQFVLIQQVAGVAGQLTKNLLWVAEPKGALNRAFYYFTGDSILL